MANITTASIITIIRSLIKDNLKTDGRNVFEYDTNASFKLDTSRVSSSTIKVWQNGIEIPSTEWSFNSVTNRVTITFVTSGYSLVKGDNIIITFSYYEKYSDSELTSFIQANLPRFTQKRYFKTFYMNSINEVVTINGVNPIQEEANIIAIITAIDINPNNITVRMPDFTISPEEKMSKSEQIDKILTEFKISLGKISFLEETDNI